MPDTSHHFAFRLGASVLAAAAGSVVGLAIWLPCVVLQVSHLTLGKLLVAGAAAGLVSGMLFPRAAMELAESVAHFVFGAASTVFDELADQSPESTPWLRVLFTFGIFYAIVLALFL